MRTENFLTVLGANVRMNYKNTLIPSILLLLVIPLIYGTANLDCIKSADCLERMVALTGIHPLLVLFICSAGAAGLLFCKPSYH